MDEQFVVTLSEDFKLLTSDTGGKHLHIQLPSEIKPFGLNRNQWNIEPMGKGIVWAAGGGTYLINGRYVPLVKRSATAKTNPGKLTIATGLSDNLEELRNPSLLIRELFEEILIIDKENRILVPFTDSSLDSEILRWIRSSADNAGVKSDGTKETSAVIARSYKDSVEVSSQNSKTQTDCFLSYHPPGSINVLFVVELDLHSLEDHRFEDTEVIIQDGRQVPLKREIFIFDIKDNLILDNQFRRYSQKEFEITSHASELIQFIRGDHT